MLVRFLLGAAISLHAQQPSKLDQFLASKLGATPAHLAALKQGEPFAIPLAGAVDREVVVAGAIRILGPAERTVALIRDIGRLESGKGFLHTRKLSSPPTLKDFSAFELDKDDVAALRKCRPGKCGVKLGKGAFDSLARVDWSSPDAHSRVNELARRSALEYIEAYRRGGNKELAIYVDSERPRFVAEEFADLIQRTSLLPAAAPSLADFLLRFPESRPEPGVEDYYYWSVADFGLKPVFRLNHVVVQPVRNGTSTRFLVATKQLYATHYFQTALELRALVDDEANPGKAHYLLVLNAARSDGLTGTFGGLIKAKARSGSRNGLEAALRATKRLVE